MYPRVQWAAIHWNVSNQSDRSITLRLLLLYVNILYVCDVRMFDYIEACVPDRMRCLRIQSWFEPMNFFRNKYHLLLWTLVLFQTPFYSILLHKQHTSCIIFFILDALVPHSRDASISRKRRASCDNIVFWNFISVNVDRQHPLWKI